MHSFDFRFSIFDCHRRVGARGVVRAESTIANRQSRTAFTLIELLLAMFILAIGLAAIGAIFPAGTYLQRQTLEEVTTLQVKRNAEAILLSRGIDKLKVTDVDDTDAKVVALPPAALDDFPVADRSYPTGGDALPEERSFYWVPLIQDADASDVRDWRVFVFILAKKRDVEYSNVPGGVAKANPGDDVKVPKVYDTSVSGIDKSDKPYSSTLTVGASGYMQPGDQLLLNNGQIVTVIEADGGDLRVGGEVVDSPDRAWYGRSHAEGRQGPTRRIIALGSEVVR